MTSGSGQRKPRLIDRFRDRVLRPIDPEDSPKGAYELSGRELEIEQKRLNEKERAIGLLAGPVATLIAFAVVHEVVTHDPAQYLSNGAANSAYVNPSIYYELFVILLILSFGMSAMAMWRKRIPLGIATALYGLAIFNMHYWGFGVPFVLVGAWYLVRAYRLNRNLRESNLDNGPAVTSRPPLPHHRTSATRRLRSLGSGSRPVQVFRLFRRRAIAISEAINTTSSAAGTINRLHDARSLRAWRTVATSPGSFLAAITLTFAPMAYRESLGTVS